MKRLATQLILVAMVYVGSFHTDWPALGLPDWVASILTPTPAPIVAPGYHVLIVYDNDQKASLPKDQLAALDSGALRSWLSAHCDRLPDGTHGWRIVDKSLTFGDDQMPFKAAMAERPSDFCVIVSNGKTGERAPFPANETALMELLNKYALSK